MKTRYWPIVILLLIHLYLRAHHITAQVPHIDEGFHVSRAVRVWSFEQNPGRFMHGKLLLYYWLGIFDPVRISGLHLIRTAIALWSLLTAALIYMLGRRFHSHAAGLLGMGIYTVIPFAVFFERLAMADGFAAAFAPLVAWRGLVYSRRPSYREGAILGVLIMLGMMAKLTMAPIAFLPVLAALVYYPWERDRWRDQTRDWLRIYVPPLVLAASIVVIAWLPILIPALVASTTDEPFTLLSQNNLQQVSTASPIDYWRDVYPQIIYMVTDLFYPACVLAAAYLLWRPASRRDALFLVGWALLLTGFSLTFANLPRPRYFMPTMIPLTLLLAYAAVALWVAEWRVSMVRPALRGALVGGGLIWLLAFALPFNQTAMDDPLQLDLSERETMLYLIGTQSGPAIESAVELLEAQEPPPQHVYASWGTCQTFFFYTQIEVGCLESPGAPVEVLAHDTSYIIYNGDETSTPDDLGLEWEQLGVFPRDGVPFTVELWRVSQHPDGHVPLEWIKPLNSWMVHP